MAEEWFDVVDAGDAVIGRALRAEVHARGLWHRAVHIIVFSSAGKIFLQKRSWKKDMSPGLWDAACSGHVDSGEGYDTAARRELHEELGIAGANPQRWFRLDASPSTGWEFIWVYRLWNDGPFVLKADEIDAGEWLTFDELEQRLAARPEEFTVPFRTLCGRVGSSPGGLRASIYPSGR